MYILNLNNPTFRDYVNAIYPSELVFKDTTICLKSASYFDLYHN